MTSFCTTLNTPSACYSETHLPILLPCFLHTHIHAHTQGYPKMIQCTDDLQDEARINNGPSWRKHIVLLVYAGGWRGLEYGGTSTVKAIIHPRPCLQKNKKITN